MARYTIDHRTYFEYAGPVREAVMEVRMQPREDEGQSCESFDLSLAPPASLSEYVDAYGNRVHHFTMPRPHETLEIVARAMMTVEPHPVRPEGDASWSDLAGVRVDRAFLPWLAESRFARSSPMLEAFAREVGPDAGPGPLAWLTALRDRLGEAIRYAPRSTRADSPIEECLAQRAGVCQDFAHVFIALARRQGVPCRYVSGHLYHREGPSEPAGEDATHAWAEAFVPGAGWMGFDASNRVAVCERHIRVAVGRDYDDVPPTRGVYRGPPTRRQEVQVRVQRVAPPAPAAEERKAVDGFQCHMKEGHAGIVAEFVGSLGPSDAEALERKMLPAIGDGPRRVVLDLSGLAMMGSAGVGALLRIQRRVDSAGGKLVLAAVPESIRTILDVSKLSRVFTMASGVEAALGA